jgi:cyclopropane fatty-acyl-phospholipid synthase-like methyltransferase
MERNDLFKNYITTQSNAELSDEKIKLENNTYDRNLRKLLPKNKEVKILEIGFGAGFFIRYLLSRGYENIYGIDLSEEETVFVKKNVYKNVECVESTENFLDKHNGEYDFIFMFDVLEHIPKDKIIDFLIKIKQALKSGAIFYARVPNASNPLNINMFGIDFTHEFIYTARSLSQINKIAEFSEVKILPCKEENISWHGKITNITQKIMIPLIKLMIGLCRSNLDPTSFYTKNIYCVCEK